MNPDMKVFNFAFIIDLSVIVVILKKIVLSFCLQGLHARSFR